MFSNWSDFGFRLITSLWIKALCLLVIIPGIIAHWLAVELTGNVFYVADILVAIPFILVPGVAMAVGTIYAHISYGFCCWFWWQVRRIIG